MGCSNKTQPGHKLCWLLFFATWIGMSPSLVAANPRQMEAGSSGEPH